MVYLGNSIISERNAGVLLNPYKNIGLAEDTSRYYGK